MNAFREDLQALVSRHVALAPAPKLLRLVEALEGDEAPLAFGMSAIAKRFTPIVQDGTPCMDPQDGEHVATYDAKTNLTWLAGPVEGDERTWQESIDAASKVRLFGFTDWRAPTIDEQLSIIDHTRSDPAVDSNFFKGPYGWTWTSTPAVAPAGCAWGVPLDDGGAFRLHQSSRGQVRAVRTGQPLGFRF